MSPFMVRLILLTATVAACAALVRFVLGPAHLRAAPRAIARAPRTRPIHGGHAKAAILPFAPRAAARRAGSKDSWSA